MGGWVNMNMEWIVEWRFIIVNIIVYSNCVYVCNGWNELRVFFRNNSIWLHFCNYYKIII